MANKKLPPAEDSSAPKRARSSRSGKSVVPSEGAELDDAVQPFPIVGIGASAGGLEAIEALFRHMPADTGMGFVLVQHLDPNHNSILTDLVSRFTRMPVMEAAQGLRVEPNHIYVIPPNRDLAILNGVLQLMEPVAPRHLRLSIDFFFRSLAQDQGLNAFCIVLSGAGSDGAMGLRVIKGEGGLVLVQSPETAAYESMPRSADATGLADAVLTPAQMGPWLHTIAKRMRETGIATQIQRAMESGGDIDKLFVLIRNSSGYDFSQYKEGTIGRRIERRMAINQTDTLADYVKLLQQNPREQQQLWKEFLIRVTQFYRNPKAVIALQEKVIDQIFKSHPPERAIRVWIAGCSSGEEAYTIAILLHEGMQRAGRSYTVQIFATDIDDDALRIARRGVYPPSVAADVPPEHLRRYFVRHPEGFQMSQNLRGMLVFSRHDLTRDAPFSHMDLVSCRNVLIYMRPHLQTRVLEGLTYALRHQGVLFLGQSESLGKLAELYEPVDKTAKLYRRRDAIIASFVPSTTFSRRRMFPIPPSLAQPSLPDPGGDGLQKLIEATLLAEYAPACVIIDDREQVLYVHGHTGLFLEPARGQASMNVLKMAREGIRHELGSAIRDVIAGKASRRHERLRVDSPHGMRLAHFTVRTLPGNAQQPAFLMVIFEDAGPVEPPKPLLPAPVEGAEPESDTRIAWLEQELADTRETLQNTNEELETNNEELQSTVEELQSSNEELTTSQEELSSINEELHTVNSELEDKVQQLQTTSADLENLLASTDIGTIFLDLDFRVRRFTEAATRVINLIDKDIGRSLADLSHKLEYQDLIADAEAVLDSLQPRAVDVRSRDGRWYSLRVTLYRTGNNSIDGVVLTFVDLTERLLAEQRFYDLLELTPDAIVLTDTNGEIVRINAQAERAFGYARDELVGKLVETLIPEALRARHSDFRRAYQREARPRAMGRAGLQLVARRKDGSEFPADIAIGPIQAPDGLLVLATIRDVSERHRAQFALERTNHLFHEFSRWHQEHILGGESLRQSLQALCARLVEHGGYRQCWLGLEDPENPSGFGLVVHVGFPENGAEMVLDSAWVDPGRSGKPRVQRDLLAADCPQALKDGAPTWGCRSLLAVPLTAGARRMGVLAVTAGEADAFSQEEFVLWTTLSASLGLILSLIANQFGLPTEQT